MAQDFHQSSFNGGMDKDISKTKIPANKYYDATNFRITTDKGSTSFDLENIKGNLNLITFPTVPKVQKLTINQSIPGNITISITNGTYADIGGTPFTVTSATTPEDLYNYILNDGGYTHLVTNYNIYFNTLYVLLVPTTATTFTITLGGTSPTSLILDANYIPQQTLVEPIGSTSIDDTIYILTTNNKTKAPGKTDPTSYGQIWKLVLDKTGITPVATLTLIYNNAVNFSTYNAIAPSAIEGRYENPSVQRIVWTDNYNKLRSMNVANLQAFALDLSLLDITPSIDFDRPIMTDIGNSGTTINVGAYQIAYRLKNTSGATTTFSELSDLVYVVNNTDEHTTTGSGNFKDYIGINPGSVSHKQITWTVSNIDPDFERIEFAILFRNNPGDVPTISLIPDVTLNGVSNYTIKYDGTQDVITISVNEFLLTSSTFTHAKTIATKDNRLLVGNIRNETLLLDYDARAYRYPTGSTTTTLTNNGITASFTQATLESTGSPFDPKADAINANTTLNAFKPGTTILGGAGINVSYEFYTEAIAADFNSNPGDPFAIPDYTPAPWRRTTSDYNITTLDLGVKSFVNDFTQQEQLIPTAFPNKINAGFKFPPYTSALRGFQREETYRFGIQFFDKSKNPTFVKWIGDIKMPGMFDANNNSFFSNGVATGITDFRLSFVGNNTGTYDECFVQTLGIKFTVNIPASLTSQIDGYSIVRVQRDLTNRSIVSQGYILPTDTGPDSNFYTTSPLPGNPSGNIKFAGGTVDSKGFFITPDFVGSANIPTATMSLKPKALLSKVNTDTSVGIGGPDEYWMFKYYNCNPLTSPLGPFTLSQVSRIDYASSTTDIASGKLVYNFDIDFVGADITVSQSIGNSAYYFKVGSNIDYAQTGAFDKLLVNIERTLSNQYNGNTYTARASNEYISCSHYRPIRTVGGAITDTFQLFGGDIFVNMYDSCRWAKNFGIISGRPPSLIGKFSSTFFLPVESVANADLRNGAYMNLDFALDMDSASREMVENYTYNDIYSAENDIKKFFPLPDPYIPNEEFNNRFYISEIKINGELTDSWSIFKTLSYWDVEGTYGPINACGSLQDTIYFAQDRAFGKLLINPKTAVTSTTGAEIQIGRGNVIDSHDYVSVENGTKHQFSWLKSAYQIYFFDVRHKKIFSFSQNRPLNPVSEIKGMSSWLKTNVIGLLEESDRPVYKDNTTGINGIHGVFDYLNGELIYTFEHGAQNATQVLFTLVYNEALNAFTAYYSHLPKLYITNHRDFFSPNPTIGGGETLWLHNYGDYGSFYGTYYDSDITPYANKYPEASKEFNNFTFQTEVQNGTTLVDTGSGLTPVQETFNKLAVSTDFQANNITLVLNTNLKRRFRTWYCEVPRNTTNAAFMSSGFFARMRDKYLKFKFSFTNNNNKRFILHNIFTFFNVNKPS